MGTSIVNGIEVGPDGKTEWAKIAAGDDHMSAESTKAKGFDGSSPIGGRVYHGHALREAFVAGAEWQEKRALTPGKFALRWEKQSQRMGWWAYSGGLVVGMVIQRDDGTICYTVTGIHVKYIAKGYGDVSSISSGKRAVERAWAKWLKRAGIE